MLLAFVSGVMLWCELVRLLGMRRRVVRVMHANSPVCAACWTKGAIDALEISWVSYFRLERLDSKSSGERMVLGDVLGRHSQGLAAMMTV